ncbi:recombinase RecT [Aureimonas pseudogalii]|uniref:Recombinase RecT n=1 Tax=Aureimonas pseudogalii TaxID=1744844 RepID=A0A7W6H4L4_9HYPH|nr:recombinase RecT [Aureimonas pseudogalii]MBB3997249.1 hypothetical protein [Aureimonas pseudogalii]
MSNVTTLAPPALASGGRVAAIVPQTMEEAYRLGKAVCLAGMAPKGMDTPEKCMIAIMQGLEVGLSPMQSLQRIAVVNGRPTIWGDGAMGLVRGSGICEFVRETIEGQGDSRSAVCTVKRRGEAEEVSRRFSVADAKKASLWGKAGPWQQYPERMLQMRARAFALRDVFADVLGGLYLREEIEDAGQPRSPPAAALRTYISPPPAIRPGPPSPAQITNEPLPQGSGLPPNPEDIFREAEEQLCVVQDIETWEEVWSEFQHYQETLFPPDWEHLIGIGQRHRERVEG